MYTSILFALATLASLSSAAPPMVSIAPRGCSISLPTSYQQIAQASPSSSFPQSRLFNVSQEFGGINGIDTLLHFTNIPSGAYGCQISMSFTYEYDIPTSGNTQLNVYALPGDISATDTYATYFADGARGTPAGAYLWTTTTVTGKAAVLNSKTCESSMSFLFQIASDVSAGAVSFMDAGNNLSGIGGFYVTYNC